MAVITSRLASCVTLIFLLAASARAKVPSEAERRRIFREEMRTNPIFPSSGDQARRAENVVIALQNQVIDQGCNLNACFAMDGSKEISPQDFRRQGQFIAAVTSIAGLDPQFHAAAFQYGLRLREVQGLTSDISKLILAVSQTPFEPAAGSFLAPAIIHCSMELRRRFSKDANSIVLIGDGRSQLFGQDFAVMQAEQFLPPHNNGAIVAVTVRTPDFKFWDRVTQDRTRVIDIDNYDRFFSILREVVQNVCQLV